VWGGGVPSPWDVGSGRRLCPSPKFLGILILKSRVMDIFWMVLLAVYMLVLHAKMVVLISVLAS